MISGVADMTNASTLWVYPSVQLSKQTLVYLIDSGSKKKRTEISYTSTYKERQSLCKIRPMANGYDHSSRRGGWV